MISVYIWTLALLIALKLCGAKFSWKFVLVPILVPVIVAIIGLAATILLALT